MEIQTNKISIVLPVYNGEKYLSNAISSVLGQSYPLWELLVVDDGSTDTSAAICDDYARKDARIRVFHQRNGGVNAARAMGIDHASGDYLTFLDADDAFLPHALEFMVGLFQEGIDLVAHGTQDRDLDKEDYIQALWRGETGLVLWGKMFRTRLFRSTDYRLDRKLVMGEDLLLNSVLALNIKAAHVFTHGVYDVNLNNEASVTRTFKHNWEYEKFYFHQVDERFLSHCTQMDSYEAIRLLVGKSRLNAMKYVMLDGNTINYNDPEFQDVRNYFRTRLGELGPSERLIFIVMNARLYKWIIRSVMKLKGLKK